MNLGGAEDWMLVQDDYGVDKHICNGDLFPYTFQFVCTAIVGFVMEGW